MTLQLRVLEDENRPTLERLRWWLGVEVGSYVVECPHDDGESYAACRRCLGGRTLARCDVCGADYADHAAAQLLLCRDCWQQMAVPVPVDADAEITLRVQLPEGPRCRPPTRSAAELEAELELHAEAGRS